MRKIWVFTLSIAAMLAMSATGFTKDDVEPKGFVTKTLQGLRLGQPIRADPIILIPLIATDAPTELSIATDLHSKKLRAVEPEWPERRFNVAVENKEEKPVLLLGGSYLVGGKLDRLVPRDLIVPADSRIQIETLPAEYSRDPKVGATPFRFGVKAGGAIAPVYLRGRARFDPSKRLVPIFISHFEEFREKGDPRHSLAAIDNSRTLAAYCIVCQGLTRGFTELENGRVVGFMTAVRGRLHVVEIFGTNALLRRYFNSVLKAHSYNAAAIELRAKKLGIPIPGRDDPKKSVEAAKKQAESLLDELKRKLRVRRDELPRGFAGESVLLRTKKSQGAAVTLDGRLVHAVIFPENPFEESLYSRPIAVPAEVNSEETAFGGMARREERGTLSEYEKRLLERMRNRRR